MSNSIMNYHIQNGYPCGEDALLYEVADYYGDELFKYHEIIKTLDELLPILKSIKILVSVNHLDNSG